MSDEKRDQHHKDALAILCGGFGQSINEHNTREKVATAIKTAALLNKTISEMYTQEKCKESSNEKSR